MQKDIFNGKIDKSCISIVKITLFLSVFIFGLCGLVFLFGFYDEKQEEVARIAMLIISLLSFCVAIIFPLLTLFAIRTYPKHKKLAHFFLKEYVFNTNITKSINSVLENNNFNDFDSSILYEFITHYIINLICSKEIREYLLENKNKLTIMQYATIVENYGKENKKSIFEALKYLTNDSYEKELFAVAIKDFSKYKRINDRTNKFYSENDFRDKKPYAPFEEFIYLPTIFKEYDLALLLGEQPKIVMIGRSIKFDENDTEDNKNYDFSDSSYMAYDLDTTFEISEENLVNIHVHAHYCELEKIGNSNLTSKQLENYLKLTKVLKEHLKEL